MLCVQNLSKSLGSAAVFQGISFSVEAQEAVALTGESGSGKSTLLHLVAGLDAPDHGQVLIAGQDITGLDDRGRAQLRRDRLGLVFQQFNLIPSLTVAANLRFQAELCGRLERDWLAHLTDRLGLADLTRRYPEELSGGQQQRVAIGRALAARPPLILADEPTGNLDEATGDAVVEIFRDLIAQTGAALVMVTHSTRLAQGLDRQLHLSRGALSEGCGP